MNPRSLFHATCASLFLALGATEARAGLTTFTQWDFKSVVAAPVNSPAPNVGTGVATILGMTNPNFIFSGNNTITGTGTFTYSGPITTGSVAYGDVTATSGAPSGDANTWRVRGEGNSLGTANGTGNGWNLAAPQYSQGAQFSTSTAGYSNISFHFDWYTTTQGVKNLQEQYTLDGTNYLNINNPLTAVSNAFYPSTLTVDFSGIAGVANDPNFGVRLVSAYDNTLPFPNYGSADGGQGGYYNNNSGNWRFTNVGFSGTPSVVPEPSSLLLVTLAGGLLVACARGRRARD